MYRQLTVPILQVKFYVLFHMLEQTDPLLECYIFHRIVEECVVNRLAVELMAIIMNNASRWVVTLWYRTTWNCVKIT